MTGIPDELVEKAARAMAVSNVRDDYSYASLARAALEAVGLPTLLERVEAAEALNERVVTTVQRFRCYRCGRIFAGDRNQIDATCPKCGSDSFSRVRDIAKAGEDHA